jgi:anti-sigma regulatory factor (Ser/Thr protein kinase)
MTFETLLTIPSHPGRLNEVRRWLVEPAQQAQLTDDELADVQLAVVEACANIIEHAYGGRFDQPIALEAAANDGELTLTIRDTGDPFDVHAYQALESDDSCGGGYGIYLMRQTMDTISFDRSVTGETVLTMVKFRANALACLPSQEIGV